MPIKLFCKICHNYIKDLTEIDMSRGIHGDEICQDCGKKMTNVWSELERQKASYDNKFAVLYNKAKNDLQVLMDKVLQPKEE